MQRAVFFSLCYLLIACCMVIRANLIVRLIKSCAVFFLPSPRPALVNICNGLIYFHLALNASPISSLYAPTSFTSKSGRSDHSMIFGQSRRHFSKSPFALRSASARPFPRVGQIGQDLAVSPIRRPVKEYLRFYSSVIGSVWPLRPDRFDRSATLRNVQV